MYCILYIYIDTIILSILFTFLPKGHWLWTTSDPQVGMEDVANVQLSGNVRLCHCCDLFGTSVTTFFYVGNWLPHL